MTGICGEEEQKEAEADDDNSERENRNSFLFLPCCPLVSYTRDMFSLTFHSCFTIKLPHTCCLRPLGPMKLMFILPHLSPAFLVPWGKPPLPFPTEILFISPKTPTFCFHNLFLIRISDLNRSSALAQDKGGTPSFLFF